MRGADRFRELLAELPLPAVAAPMTGVSTPALVIAARRAGIIGAFPTRNAASSAELDEWFDEIAEGISGAAAPGPLMANLIVGRQNTRLDADVEAVVARGAERRSEKTNSWTSTM